MNAQQQAYIQTVEQNLAKSRAFERLGFQAGQIPTQEEVEFTTEEICKGIVLSLPLGDKQDDLIAEVRKAGQQALQVNAPERAAIDSPRGESSDVPGSESPVRKKKSLGWAAGLSAILLGVVFIKTQSTPPLKPDLKPEAKIEKGAWSASAKSPGLPDPPNASLQKSMYRYQQFDPACQGQAEFVSTSNNGGTFALTLRDSKYSWGVSGLYRYQREDRSLVLNYEKVTADDSSLQQSLENSYSGKTETLMVADKTLQIPTPHVLSGVFSFVSGEPNFME